MQGLDNVCMGCERRHVGCRSACPDWAKHEKRKAERYRESELSTAGRPVSMRMAQARKQYVKEIKRGRCV